MPRLFIAAWPPPAITDLVDGLSRPDEPGARWTEPDQWHVTLRFLGPADQIEADQALTRVDARVAEARLGPQVVRLGRSAIVVPVTGLEDLAAAVRAATRHVGEPVESRPFVGHITLARVRHGGARGLVGQRVSGSWPVDEIALVSSERDPDRARYATVARRRLDPAAP